MIEHGRLGPIEWAAASLPMAGETECGDRALAVDHGGDLALFGVIDGLGHGAAAAAAAERAAELLGRAPADPLNVLIDTCHRELASTRGAAMTLAQIDLHADVLRWMGVGNVTATLAARAPNGMETRSSARLLGGIVGYRMPELPQPERISIRPGHMLVVASDGIAEEHVASLDFAASATAAAGHILDRYRKETDDALVLVARHRGFS
ncbi:MAG: phosphoserine phosphatase RsbX [Pseudonocardiales bacterium]|nr:phosphoserine phosphatase RsbX [Pseudonocardiales bacterium]